MASELSESQVTHKETTFSARLVEFAEEGHHFEAQRMPRSMFQEVATSEAIEALPICRDDFTGSNTGDLFKCQIPNVEIQNHAKKRIGPARCDYMLDNHSLKAGLTNSKHEVSNFIDASTSRFAAETKGENGMIANGVRSLRPQRSGESMRMQKDSWSGGLCDRVTVHQSINKMHNFSIPNVEILRMHATSNSMDNVNGESQTYPNSSHHCLFTEKVDNESSHGEQLNVNSVRSAKGKCIALYEMLTAPNTSESHPKQQGHSQVMGCSSISFGGCGESSKINAHKTRTRKRSPVKTATMSVDACEKQVSPRGLVSDEPRKDLEHPRLIKSHIVSASQVKQGVSRDAETQIFDKNIVCLTSSDRTRSINLREPSTSQTEIMSLDQVLSQTWRPKGSNSGGIAKSSLQAEPCSRWLKRMRHNHLDFFHHATKKFRTGDGPLTREASSLLHKVIDFNSSRSDMMKYLLEQHIVYKTKHWCNGSNIRECPAEVSPKKIHSWVERWCYKGSEAASSQAKLATPVPSKPENSKLISEEQQFPSIGAMALMKKVLNNTGTYEFQRNGSSIVWNTED